MQDLKSVIEGEVSQKGKAEYPILGVATHCSILAWRIPMDREIWWATVHGVAKSQTQWSN